ncbi:hypothetical protein GCM10009416_11330 [Craurococcus roseus]|uniref:Uncharacterized protein n=1 Tax=Craurococcus roseus TaxID=77585 RepID=A0ABP3PSG1_9PROT
MAPLPFPPPAILVASPLASAPARSLADLARTLDTAQRALRALEDHACGVPGVLAARVRDCAAEAAGAVEAHGYDLFLAAGRGDPADEDADGEGGR